LCAALLAATGVAQKPDSTGPVQQTHAVHRRARLEDRVKVLAESLHLDNAQQLAVTKILEERQQETLRIRRDTSISGSDRMAQFRAIQDRTVLRIQSVLNEEQKKKYDPLAVRRVEPAAQQRSVEDWIKATTPH
jgi:ABC-type lipopolysaccharide export system ATPase subunit